VEVATAGANEKKGGEQVSIDSIPLQMSNLRNPFQRQQPPIRFGKRIIAVGLNILAWIAVLLIIRMPIARKSRWGPAFLVFCSIVNALALVMLMPRLAWW